MFKNQHETNDNNDVTTQDGDNVTKLFKPGISVTIRVGQHQKLTLLRSN